MDLEITILALTLLNLISTLAWIFLMRRANRITTQLFKDLTRRLWVLESKPNPYLD
jgi:hypothetical protein